MLNLPSEFSGSDPSLPLHDCGCVTLTSPILNFLIGKKGEGTINTPSAFPTGLLLSSNEVSLENYEIVHVYILAQLRVYFLQTEMNNNINLSVLKSNFTYQVYSIIIFLVPFVFTGDIEHATNDSRLSHSCSLRQRYLGF